LKIRITTTLGLIIETALFDVAVVDCNVEVTLATPSSPNNYFTTNPAPLAGTTVVGSATTNDAVRCPLTTA
jgi:hypothetical protein